MGAPEDVTKSEAAKMESLPGLLKSEDPLSDSVFEYLLQHKEEDEYADFKESIDPKNEKDWLELTKDIMAFANTYGGYLVFGIQDKTYNQIGLNPENIAALTNIDIMQQKINRYVEPPISHIRAKSFIKKDKTFVVVFIPESISKTHVVAKDGSFKYTNGESKQRIVLHKGTIYVRRSGGNRLCAARDIDEIVDKRIKYFKKTLMSDLARVVESPAGSEVYILSQDPSSDKKYIIEDAPDAIKMIGMSFTVSPKTFEEAIAACIALFESEPPQLPASHILWNWYHQREKIQITKEQKLSVAKFNIVSDVPVFFWLKGCPSESIFKMLKESINLISSSMRIDIIVGISAFLGNSKHNKIMEKACKKYKVSQKFCTFPANPFTLFSPEILGPRPQKVKDLETFYQKQLQKLNEIAATGVIKYPGVWEKRYAHAVDCYLYAQNDKYRSPVNICTK